MIDIKYLNEPEVCCRNIRSIVDYVQRYDHPSRLPQLFNGILEPCLSTSNAYSAYGKALNLEYLTDSKNWLPNSVSLKIFENLASLQLCPYQVGYRSLKNAASTRMYILAALFHLVGTKGCVARVNQINQQFNRTKQVEIKNFSRHSGQIELHYLPGCAHSNTITQQNLGFYVATLELFGFSEVSGEIKEDVLCPQNGYSLLEFQFKPEPFWKRLKWLWGFALANLFCRTYLKSHHIFTTHHKTVIDVLQDEIESKEQAARERESYYQLLMQEKLAKQEELQQLVHERTLALKQQIAAKRTMFENISHELKTPLAVLLGRLEQLKQSASLGADSTLSSALIGANRLHQLIQQLLSLAEIEQQAAQPAFPVYLAQVTNDYLNLLSPEIEAKSLQLTTRITEESCALVAQLKNNAWDHILSNLLSNAIKFSPEGGQIWVNLEADNGQALLSVSNQCEALLPENISAHLFERFIRLNTSSQTEGSGIGLAIVKEYVELHGGTVSISAMKQDTMTVTVCLPAEKRITPSAQEVAFSSGKPFIWVVEDDKEMREYISSLLQERFSPLTFQTGLAAYQSIIDQTVPLPDLILSDVAMPEMDGVELCQKLKQSHELTHIPVILLTAKAQLSDVHTGFNSGAEDYVTKPFEAQALLHKITSVLQTRESFQKRLRKELLAEKVVFDDQEPAIPLDSQLSDRLKEAISEHHSNSAFGVSALASLLYMSEKTLGRRCKALLNQSPSYLIREFRLNKAKSMLVQGVAVKQVADECGFSTVPHFTSSFKSFSGQTPAQYAKDQKEELEQ